MNLMTMHRRRQAKGFHFLECFLKFHGKFSGVCCLVLFEGGHADENVIGMGVIASPVTVRYHRAVAHEGIHGCGYLGEILNAAQLVYKMQCDIIKSFLNLFAPSDIILQ